MVKRFWASSRLYHLIEKVRAAEPPVQEMEDEHGNDIEAPWRDAGLNQTQKETSSKEPGPILHETLSDSDTSKEKHPSGDWKETECQRPHRSKSTGGEFSLRQRRGRKRMIPKLPRVSNNMKGTKLYAKG